MTKRAAQQRPRWGGGLRGRLTTLWLGAALAAAAGCGGSSSNPTTSSATSHKPVTITMWDLYGGEEGKPFQAAFKGFHKLYPWITVKQVLQPNTDNDTFDPNLVAALKGGAGPDVALAFGPDYIGQYCSSGLWKDLTPFMQRDHVSIDQFAKAALTYTNFAGKQCALPSLTDAYGLYYNKTMLAKQHISPPKTMDELMADAKKLTVLNPDGSIKVAGFVPLDFWEELGPPDLARAWNAQWFDASGNPILATDPGWTAAFNWQKQLVDFYGYNNIERFFATYNNAEFNPTNGFENGKVAMVFDGEWRTAFITRDKSKVNYGTTFFPAAVPSVYGSGRVGGDVVGMTNGTKHPDEAWLLVKYLATDTKYLTTMAGAPPAGVGNVPTTAAAGKVSLNDPPQFKTFIDVWNNPLSSFSPPLQASGGGYADLVNTFDDKWVKGQIPDLHAALVQLDQDIKNQLSQGQVP